MTATFSLWLHPSERLAFPVVDRMAADGGGFPGDGPDRGESAFCAGQMALTDSFSWGCRGAFMGVSLLLYGAFWN
jgi:hypothetical protein